MESNHFSFLKPIISLTSGKEAGINERTRVVKLQSDENFPEVMSLQVYIYLQAQQVVCV